MDVGIAGSAPPVSFCSGCGAAASGARFCASCGRDLINSAVSPAVASVPVPRQLDWGGIVLVIAGALAALGSFLPWITATAAFVGTISRNGIDGGGDGIFTIVLGIVIVLIGVARLAGSGRPRTMRIGAGVGAVALGVVTWLDVAAINERISSLDSTAAVGSLGMGIIVIGIAAVLAFIGALVAPAKAIAR
jgi:hypothetical protein